MKKKNDVNLGSTLRNKKKPQKDVKKTERIVEAVHTEKNKRLTLEVPLSLHAKIKTLAAQEGTSIKEYVTNLLKDNIQVENS